MQCSLAKMNDEVSSTALSSNVDTQTTRGNSTVHYCCLHNKTECLKLLLRAKANTHLKNELGETAMDISRKLKHTHCEELIQQSQANLFNMHVHVEYEWRLRHDDPYESDDELEDKMGPVKKERSSCSRPFSFYQTLTTTSSIALASVGGGGGTVGGGGLFSVGRRLAMARENKHTNSHTRSLDSPPPPPPSSPAPPLPPRVKAPSVPPPPPPVTPPEGEMEGEGWGDVFLPPSTSCKRRTPPPPLAIRHKRTYSEPSPPTPQSPHTHRKTDYGLSSSPRVYGGPESSFQKCVSGSPKYPAACLNSLAEVPERGFRMDEDSNSSHFLYPMTPPNSRAPPLSSPTNHRSLSLDTNGGGHTPHPLPRRSLPRPRVRRAQALYDCVADHHDELSFTEGQLLVVLGEEDADWWHGFVEGQPGQRGLFPSSFVQMLVD